MEKRKILILDPFSDESVEKIKKIIKEEFFVKVINNYSEEELLLEMKDAEIIIGEPSIKLLQNKNENCPRLKFIQMTWSGVDIYTRNSLPFPKDKIILANARGAYGMIISQFVIGMIISLMLNFKQYHNQQQEKIWKRGGSIKSLEKAKVLIFGAGDIGTYCAKRLKGFDAYCIGVCKDVNKKREYFDEVCSLDEAIKHFSEVDVVIGAIPSNKETERYFDKIKLNMLKKGSIIVNVGRGNFIDCSSLDELLKTRHLWGAALDVTDPEPLPQNHPLWSNPYCMITPHASGITFGHLKETEELVCEVVMTNLLRYCNNEEIINSVF